MNDFPGKKQIINAVLSGIETAHKTNLGWTNNNAWLSIAPEYMINIFIGQSIAKMAPRPEIWFEVSVKDLAASIFKNNHEKNIDKFIKLVERNNHQNEKIDIVLDDGEYSRVIIEVKNGVNKSDILKDDIIRICKALKEASTLDYGLIAFFANVSAKKTIAELIKQVQEMTQSIIDENKFAIQPVKIDSQNFNEIDKDEIDGWTGAAVCFVLERIK